MSKFKNSAFLNDNWTPEEDSILEELLVKYSSKSKAFCYTQIALQLKDKCIRDVVMRCRWLNENYKKQGRDHILSKYLDKKENLTESMPKLTGAVNNTNGPPNAQEVMQMDSDGGISYQAGGSPSGRLLEQNDLALDQISANFAALKIEENINLLSQAQNNIRIVLNNLNDALEMKRMPPLPVKLNEEPVNSILQKQSSFPDKS